MIFEQSPDGTGYARFSDDRKMRYRLARMLTPRAIYPSELQISAEDPIRRVVWIMCNPSTADAFKSDPTVTRCCEFSRRWNADICEIVNLFALRSSDPNISRTRRMSRRGIAASFHICGALTLVPTSTTIAKSSRRSRTPIRARSPRGGIGRVGGRAEYVRGLLRERHIELEALRFSKHGYPNHPLARGKSFIPYDVKPVRFA